MSTESASITIFTDLLAAIAKWASDDIGRNVGRVAFRDGEIIATDGTRLVRVPLKLTGGVTGTPRFLVLRRDVLAAIAAQDVMARDGIEPQLAHDVEAHDNGDAMITDGPYGNRTITLTHIGGRVVFGLGGLDVNAIAINLDDYPSHEKIHAVMVKPSGESPPDGIFFQPRLLAAVDEIVNAAWARHGGVRCTGWGGHKSAMQFETQNGVRMVIMPMKQPEVSGG